jgi:hypothetical protein
VRRAFQNNLFGIGDTMIRNNIILSLSISHFMIRPQKKLAIEMNEMRR